MNAQIIAFPSGRAIPAQPEAAPQQEVEFLDWFEDNVPALVTEAAELDALAFAVDIEDFWAQARALRSMLNSWPIPEES